MQEWAIWLRYRLDPVFLHLEMFDEFLVRYRIIFRALITLLDQLVQLSPYILGQQKIQWIARPSIHQIINIMQNALLLGLDRMMLIVFLNAVRPIAQFHF